MQREGIEITLNAMSDGHRDCLLVQAWWRPTLTKDVSLARFVHKVRAHRLFEQWGLARRDASHDPVFDSTIHTQSTLDSQLVFQTLGIHGRDAICRVLSMGWSSVCLNSKAVQFERPMTLESLTLDSVEVALEGVLQLCRALQSAQPALPIGRPASMLGRVGLPAGIVAMLSAYGLVGQSMILFLPSAWPHLVSSAIGVVLAALLTAVVALARKNTLTAFRDISGCAVVFMAVVPWSLTAWLPLLNGWLDDSTAQRCPSVLLRTIPSGRTGLPCEFAFRGIDGDTRELIVPDMFDGRPRVRLPGTPMTLLVHEGFFGWRYLVDIE